MRSESLTVRCRRRWPEIMAHLAPREELLQAIERGSRRAGWCPVHRGQHGDAFRVFKDFVDTGGAVCNTCGKFGTGFKVLMWINGWDEVTTGRELRRFLDGDQPAAPINTRHVVPPIAPVQEERRRPSRDVLMKLWDAAMPLTHDRAEPVRRYFARRGLRGLDLAQLQSLRCHPDLVYTESETRKRVGRFPALLGFVVDVSGELVALHRTYLTDDGEKAPVKPVKKLLNAEGATASGGCVRLQAVETVGPILCTCEGLENGLTALVRNPHLPFWPATSAPLLGALMLPPQVRHLVIWGDVEPAQRQPDGSVRQPGRDAADKLATRIRADGRSVEMLFPRAPVGSKYDWNTVLLDHGVEAIPRLSSVVRMLPTAFRLAQLRHGIVMRS